jgi:hypothetical protein
MRYGFLLITGVVSLIVGLLLDRWWVAMAKKKRKANPHCLVVKPNNLISMTPL